MKKLAFTLAEVLLTLTIIGVVAALTLPSVTGSLDETELTAQAKKAYNTLQNAVKSKYVKTGAAPNAAALNIVQYLTNGDSVLNTLDINGAVALTADGQAITSCTFDGAGAIIVVDVNGVDGPNYNGARKDGNIKALACTAPIDYSSAQRDIVHFRIDGINIIPHPNSGTAQMYIRGIK